MSVSCVCASDNTNATVIGDYPPITIDVDNITVPGTYDDLNNDIQNIASGSTYDITRDYKFDGKGQTIILQDRVIKISQDNIVINGNGHTIDAGGFQSFAIFKILGNNVTIKDLVFINSQPNSLKGPTLYGNTTGQRILSPISWQGSNGVMEGCSFYNNCAVNGGAVTWNGDNGTIDNCYFENNTARGVAGALYIGGTNNTVSNCRFVNSSSQLSGEAIYMDRNRKNINFVNDNFTNSYPVIDGAVIGLDTDYLYYSRMIHAYGNLSTSEGYRINIIPLIYKAIVNGGISNINDFMKYYAQYNNETGLFTLNIAAIEKLSDSTSHMDLEYLKSVCFTNITDINQVFDAAIHGNYTQDITQVIVGYVSNTDDYNRLVTASAFGLWFNTDKGVRTLSNGLRIIFTDKLVINSEVSWNPKSMGYNTITIFGNGSTINGNAGDRDEKKWLIMDGDITFIANDLTIKDFNTAVECLQGTCYFNNIKFDGNRMDYYIDRDWGAAILNTGIVICNNCTFTDNYAKYGGAIFNQGFLALNNCTFSGNTAYGKEGDNVCVGDGGHVCVDGVNVTATKGAVYFAQSISKSSATWASIACIAGSFAIGFIAGVITANPIAGIAIGAAVGAALGTVTASQIISSSYDIHHDRLSTCLFVIGGSVLAGAAGGFAGYLAVTASFAPAAEAGEGIPYSYGEFDEVSVESEPVIRTLFGK